MPTPSRSTLDDLFRGIIRDEVRFVLREEEAAANATTPRGLSFRAAADRLGIGVTLLRRLVAEGSIAIAQVGRRKVISETEIARVLAEGALAESNLGTGNVLTLPAVQAAADARRDAQRPPRRRSRC